MRPARDELEPERALAVLLASLRAGDDALEAAVAVRRHGADRVEPRLRALERDARWEARAAVAAVLRWLPGPDGAPPAPEIARDRAALLGEMAERETDPRALVELVAAFVDLRSAMTNAETAALALRYVGHDDARVRHAALCVLYGLDREDAIEALIHASRDADPRVRDAACFGLGHMLGSPTMPGGIVDTDAIREALAARLDDDDVEAREEAATGLALRGDARGIEAVERLLARFDDDGVSTRALHTAAEAPHARYVPHLEVIVRELPHLREAVVALDEARAAVPRPRCRGPRLHAACDCFRGLPGLPRG